MFKAIAHVTCSKMLQQIRDLPAPSYLCMSGTLSPAPAHLYMPRALSLLRLLTCTCLATLSPAPAHLYRSSHSISCACSPVHVEPLSLQVAQDFVWSLTVDFTYELRQTFVHLSTDLFRSCGHTAQYL